MAGYRAGSGTAMIAVVAMVVMVVAHFPAGTEAQTPPAMAPSPAAEDCMTALLNMSDCLSYVETGSNLTKPDKGCCPELAGLVESNPICLCQLLGNPEKTGFQIDFKKALALPSVCKVDTPPVSLCAAVGIPVGAPQTSPAASPAAGDLAPEGSAAASPSTTTTTDSGNGVSSLLQLTTLHFFLGLLALVLSTNFL